MPEVHAILSASSSKRWLNCTPSARLEQNFPNESSVYAEEGTAAHALGEYKLRKYLHERVKRPTSEYEDEEMEANTDIYAEFIISTVERIKETCPHPLVMVEERLDYSYLVPSGFGTGDCVIIADGTLYVMDYKNGKGVFVNCDHNPQMMLYALGAYHAYGYLYSIKKVSMTIIQPRLDMRTLEFREHRPEDYLTMESGITYDPDADCPRWHSFIKEVMCGDADLADFLQRSLGYALTGDTSQECMFILYGATSRNGKGTAMETFLKIMGDYGKTSNPDMLAAKFRGGNTGGPSEEVARLVGSRFVNISEPEKKITFNAALVKRMTGNDTINARFLNENSFDFVPVFKIFINTNYLPNVNDMTLFQSGRLKIIPFNRHFEEGEQDQGLKGQFAKPENLSGIFNWCLEGYKKFCQRGLELPQAVTKATEDYKDDSDRIGQFIEAWLEKEDGSELRTAAAYQLYTKWCEENGYSSENQKNFKNAIGVHFKVVRKRPKGGGGQTTLIMDCKFKEVESGAEDLTVQDAYKPKDSLL